jgi:hypothetical protein
MAPVSRLGRWDRARILFVAMMVAGLVGFLTMLWFVLTH